MTDFQRRLKLLLCLSTSLTKIHSARVMVTCAKMATWCHVLSTWHVHVCNVLERRVYHGGFKPPIPPWAVEQTQMGIAE